MGLQISVQQQHIAVPGEQQPILMTTARNPSGRPQSFTSNMHQAPFNSVHLAAQSWGRVGYQAPGIAKQVCLFQGFLSFLFLPNIQFLFHFSLLVADGKQTCKLFCQCCLSKFQVYKLQILLYV